MFFILFYAYLNSVLTSNCNIKTDDEISSEFKKEEQSICTETQKIVLEQWALYKKAIQKFLTPESSVEQKEQDESQRITLIIQRFSKYIYELESIESALNDAEKTAREKVKEYEKSILISQNSLRTANKDSISTDNSPIVENWNKIYEFYENAYKYYKSLVCCTFTQLNALKYQVEYAKFFAETLLEKHFANNKQIIIVSIKKDAKTKK
ncbi:hypothetical protein EDEG_03962 [Edhazardia aedis USNM 41457]|uniref:Uncharacterized protein n=1 Tax=Edhazardia aedis (strain USNM 41457) TaxID=1003232 RepID=J9D1G6_EDHAE|nr:hypothetical protein EDEG_03962 [Edhazardia aedis USNM 41457]|eukprot:EJW01419.1 hypothetical protein EDEG_03962 [Edhazardia aedis USNM 41457]